ncbi:unnamed protein product, partial [Gongylonema pulchrum]|uniref:Microtubule-associated protein Jupiter n=1 Tax=Gongylonema pulchrum TaxID=637853 RepID=A0A183DJ51_9BILA
MSDEEEQYNDFPGPAAPAPFETQPNTNKDYGVASKRSYGRSRSTYVYSVNGNHVGPVPAQEWSSAARKTSGATMLPRTEDAYFGQPNKDSATNDAISQITNNRGGT